MSELWRQVGLRESEYRLICEQIGREPNETEIRMYGVLWSEHCAYKHSRPLLKKLPTEGPRVIQGPGENAGVVDLGDGLHLAFKVESHNHPSYIEPLQGAATGVGGILRDIFTMGARPIALLDSLRFGPPGDPRQRYLLGGVVAGIGHYGNCMGVPTVGGEVYFEEAYGGNCIVNAMCAGLVAEGGIRRGVARGEGNPVLVVGARTGRDGIGGASFASEELGEASEERRPSVQVGDPFLEKLLLEACLELYETGSVVGIQDCGAAGLTSACAEMAHRGGVGMEIDVRRVPRREAGMLPWEVMISESQERMVVCLERGREDEARRIFAKWGLEAAVIGHVTGDGLFRVRDGEAVVAEVPVASLAGGAPTYTPEKREPAYLAALRGYDLRTLPEPEDYGRVLLQLLASPNLCSREWIYRQYDHMVLLGTVVGPGGDAALLRLPGTDRGVALKIDGNGRYCYLNPRRGAAIAVAEAARNVSVTGAEPVAITNNLNFGNPEKPEIYWQLDEAIEGIAEACRALGTPVTGGNVSLYNERDGEAIYPTPTIGMVGVHPDVGRHAGMGLAAVGDVIVLVGPPVARHLGGTEYLKVVHGLVAGDAPPLDLDLERRVQAAVREAVRQGLATAAHDVAEGGLAVALAEMAVAARAPGLGAQVSLFVEDSRVDAALFGEDQSRVIVTCRRDDVVRLTALFMAQKVPYRLLGDVTGDGRFRVAVLAPGHYPGVYRRAEVVDLPVADLQREWKEGLPRWVGA
ncbi:phosphoribosylformylglycinamidine synthase subunit PurL [Caldinitratiruptor microaerophilus]|uniref:Phosphoribosylformylglycinamidine synthase subunit PurL n=1 Tax=Caldinitratiruptor microaerophilus TaxID=671077 RepID=A0AA35CMT8_9FIRM|nr:phosphoribosylformylglycinamidine synthase subunit PurL [Caldinitratiruptor microaerophilus]BDG61283.1 phosphoribosylformylglycinamidine synthase subunit PurL [Caldinitratiruptor microaerophilus]